ncbi:MAG: CotH kinase family protein [Gemmatimonadaceae bacterium]
MTPPIRSRAPLLVALLVTLVAACSVSTEPPPPNERAMAKITAFANAPTAAPPTVADYTDAGVTGVTAANLAAVNAAVSALAGPDVDTVAELQTIVNRVVAQLIIVAYATDDASNPAPTVETYTAAGVTGVTAAMVPGLNRVVAERAAGEVDTLTELQVLVDGVVAEAAIAPALTAFMLTKALNATLDSSVTATFIGDTIRLVIPKVMDVTSLIPTFSTSAPRAAVRIGSAAQTTGVSAASFADDVRYTVVSIGGASREYIVRVIVWTGLPVVTLNTDGGAPIVTRDFYIPGSVSVYGGKDHPEWSFTTVTTQVKGRGNSTWHNPKKPYRLKLASGRSMLGAPSDRDWTLLANYWDVSLARNAMAFEASRLVGMAYTPRCQPVELILNGVHQGSYQLCEHMETATDRIPAGTGGWLLEMNDDGRIDPGDVFFQTPRIASFSQEWGGTFFVYKTPDPPTAAQDSAIQAQVNRFETNLYSDGFANPDTGYAAHLDVESLIDWYLVQELVKNNDAMFINSVYFYAKAGGKITFGPLWDFDLAFGGYPWIPEPQGWRIRYSPWISRLLDDRAFIDKLKVQWQALYAQRSAIDAALVAYTGRLRESQRINHALWYPYLPKPTVMAPFVSYSSTATFAVPTPGAPTNSLFTDAMYDAEVQTLRNWLTARFAWLNTAIMDL